MLCFVTESKGKACVQGFKQSYLSQLSHASLQILQRCDILLAPLAECIKSIANNLPNSSNTKAFQVAETIDEEVAKLKIKNMPCNRAFLQSLEAFGCWCIYDFVVFGTLADILTTST